MKRYIAIIVLSLLFVTGCTPIEKDSSASHSDSIHSPYAGEEARGIKSLSPSDIDGLRMGHGTPFGGMAKLAELNGYPGPRHVLDAAKELQLSDDQIAVIQGVYDEMNSEAMQLGDLIIYLEATMNTHFREGSITEEVLYRYVHESAAVYGKLRYSHLNAHLKMMDVMSAEQIENYNTLRGYNSGNDPCENVPEGHPEDMWKMHHNCI